MARRAIGCWFLPQMHGRPASGALTIWGTNHGRPRKPLPSRAHLGHLRPIRPAPTPASSGAGAAVRVLGRDVDHDMRCLQSEGDIAGRGSEANGSSVEAAGPLACVNDAPCVRACWWRVEKIMVQINVASHQLYYNYSIRVPEALPGPALVGKNEQDS